MQRFNNLECFHLQIHYYYHIITLAYLLKYYCHTLLNIVSAKSKTWSYGTGQCFSQEIVGVSKRFAVFEVFSCGFSVFTKINADFRFCRLLRCAEMDVFWHGFRFFVLLKILLHWFTIAFVPTCCPSRGYVSVYQLEQNDRSNPRPWPRKSYEDWQTRETIGKWHSVREGRPLQSVESRRISPKSTTATRDVQRFDLQKRLG